MTRFTIVRIMKREISSLVNQLAHPVEADTLNMETENNKRTPTSRSWNKTTRYFIATLVLAGLIWLVVAAKAIIGPLAIAALLAYVLNPAVTFVNKRTRLKRQWVVIFVFLFSLAMLVAIGVLIVPLIPEQARALAQELQTIELQLEERLAAPIVFLGFTIPVNEMLVDLREVSSGFVRPDVFMEILRAASTNLAWILVILVSTYYLLQDWALLREWLIRLAPEEHEEDARRLYQEIREVWGKYLRGQLALMVIIGIMTGLGLAALGIPGAAFLGLLTGILDAILSVGPTLAMIIAAIIAWVSGSTFLPLSNAWAAIAVLALFGLIQTIENVWLRPRIMGQTLRLHPAVVVVAVIGSLALAGVLVALIIIPVLGSAVIVGRYLYRKILDEDPWAEKPPLLPEERQPVTETGPIAPLPAEESEGAKIGD